MLAVKSQTSIYLRIVFYCGDASTIFRAPDSNGRRNKPQRSFRACLESFEVAESGAGTSNLVLGYNTVKMMDSTMKLTLQVL